MPEETTPIDALKALVNSPEFAAVKSAADALDQILLLDRDVGSHLNAFRLGMSRLAEADVLKPDPEPEEVTEPEEVPEEPEHDPEPEPHPAPEE